MTVGVTLATVGMPPACHDDSEHCNQCLERATTSNRDRNRNTGSLRTELAKLLSLTKVFDLEATWYHTFMYYTKFDQKRRVRERKEIRD